MDTLSEIRRSLLVERDAVNALLDRVNEACERAVMLLHECRGHVNVTGMGKAGFVARKFASTLASIGTPAVYLHPAEAIHGDLGALRREDIMVAISNSGESNEIVELLPHLSRIGMKIIALTGNSGSTLAHASQVVIDVGVKQEADTLGLVPTASTTAAMAMGDALASALMKLKKFTQEDYGKHHPGGALGTLLHARVSELMVPREQTPLTNGDAPLRDLIVEISARRLGAAFIVDEEGRLVGIVTDGDLRRLFQREANPLERKAREVMGTDPKHIDAEAPAIEAMRLMEDHAITILPVLDEKRRPISAIHMHDLVKAGLSAWSTRRDQDHED